MWMKLRVQVVATLSYITFRTTEYRKS